MPFPYQLIDLTHALESSIPTWNAACGFHHDVHIDYADCSGPDKFRVMKIKMHSGIGTHMDAPSHYAAGGRYINSFAVNELCMPCIMIDVSQHCDEKYSLSVEEIIAFENVHGPIPAGSCVMVHTGWSQYWNNPERYHNQHIFPSISQPAAQYLFERGVAAIGIDTLSPDRPADGFHTHRIFLGSGKIIIENVACLDKLPATGAYVFIMPMKVKEGTEAPVRLVALLDKTQ